jgi:hypothetical protein
MVGAGLHLQLGYPPDSPLVSWKNLLTRAAEGLHLDDWRPKHDNYLLAWEELVLAAAKAPRQSRSHRSSRIGGRSSDAPWVAEKVVRKVIGKVLDACVGQRPTPPCQKGCRLVLDAIGRFSEAGPLHILDFNFDCLLPTLLSVDRSSDAVILPKAVSREAGSRISLVMGSDLESLYCRFPVPGGRAWFWKPHGYSKAPGRIRMGLRDCSLQPALLKYAFDHNKRAKKLWCLGSEVDQEKIRRRVSELDGSSWARRYEDTWVTRMLTLECIVIGLSISQSEWGLHWLCTQRPATTEERASCHLLKCSLNGRLDCTSEYHSTVSPRGRLLGMRLAGDWWIGDGKPVVESRASVMRRRIS